LIAFFIYLERSGRIKNAKKYQRAIDNSRGQIMSIARTPNQWGFAKQFAMEARGEGVDFSNQEELDKFMKKKQRNALGEIAKDKLGGGFLGKLFGGK
jgi:hypothetical protein